ncbi:E3 ubiquitin/ISG15 ligase TRIM25-like isoform X2 [Pseudophryne corroboree]|uniref:E3 ubiquitin/ISG15 ligase TRIM25-like isoform X2 n=1 Tax=Pseudophryne corroboree TaxID=495146 RepID=UPI00308139EA
MFVRSRSAMATAAFLCSEYLYCPVCLDLFREPVTIPCGHTFCLACITQCWSLQGMPTSCPQCRSTFRPDSSPRLCKNSILSQMVEDFSNFQESSEGMTALSNQAKTVGMPFEDLCHQNLPDGSLESKTSNKFDLPPICRNSQEAISVQEEETSIQDHKWSGLYAAVSKFKECLLELCADHMGRLVQQVWTTHSSCPILQPKLWRSPLLPLIPRVRDEFLQYYRDISLDPDTAHHNLCLMQGNRRVLCKLQPQAYPEHPGRFNHYTQVLGREPMAHGRHYWEVCLSGNRVNLGVTYHDISRKGHQSYCLAGRNSQSWCLEWNSTRCYAWHDGQRVLVATGQQEKLGIFLDWDAGSLSFHEVSDNMLLLHQFHASFIQPVYPIFFISWNSIMSLGEGTSTHHSVNSNRFHRQLSANF